MDAAPSQFPLAPGFSLKENPRPKTWWDGSLTLHHPRFSLSAAHFSALLQRLQLPGQAYEEGGLKPTWTSDPSNIGEPCKKGHGDSRYII